MNATQYLSVKMNAILRCGGKKNASLDVAVRNASKDASVRNASADVLNAS
jgi:hypothetical protein